MKEFDYLKLNNLVITPKMNAQLNHLYELRGYVANYHPHRRLIGWGQSLKFRVPMPLIGLKALQQQLPG